MISDLADVEQMTRIRAISSIGIVGDIEHSSGVEVRIAGPLRP